jgi:Ca2+-binding EF-hand superfamily protein
MSETEIIKLKKEIHHLREQNADLQADLEEKNEKLGRMETEYLKMKNETMLVTKTKLMQHSEMVKINVEKALESEKARINFLEKNYEESLKKITYFEQEKINLENHHKEIQMQNNQLKKQLQEFGQRTQTTEFIRDLRDKDENLMKKEKEYQKIVLEWNGLCDKMEDILSENRLLKELANVPANFGINIEEIKLGDRMKIEDYKAKIRILQREVDDLETERAQLKHKLVFFANALEIKEPPFSMLTTEQKKTVSEYAQALYEGKEFIVPERYELIKDNQEHKTKIEFLEKQIATMQLESNYRIYGLYNGNVNSNNKDKLNNPNMPDNFKEIIDMLKKENEDLKALLSKSLDKFSNFNEEFFKSNIQNQSGNNFNSTGQKVQFSLMQMPAIPIIDQKDVDNTGYGYSYKFDTKFKIDPNQIHSLFGIAKDDSDVEAFKIESASLQTQLIELMEVTSRAQTQDNFLNENLGKLYNKLENIVLLQNELFERYVSEKKHFRTVIEENAKTNKSLMEELHDIKRKDKALEDTISLIETKNLSQIENRALEKMKESSILEINYIKLTRKHESLLDEECKIRKLAEEIEKNSVDKDIQLEGTIIKLKEWKQILSFYLKLLMKKIKKSVDRDEFNKILDENKYLREKYNEMVVRDINITKQISLAENLKIKLKEVEENFYNSEEMRIDSEIELNYLKSRLQESDSAFYLQEKIFRKFFGKLNEFNLSFSDIRKTFDPNNSGKISKNEFIIALKTMNIYTSFIVKDDLNEIELLIKSLNFDDDSNLDAFYFIRKLERIGVLDSDEAVSSDEKILQDFVEGIKNSGVNLKSVFELFDSSGDGLISTDEFKFALQQLNLKISDEILSKIFFLINGNQTTTNTIPAKETSSFYKSYNKINLSRNDIEYINYSQFCAMFDQKSRYLSLKNKKNQQFKSNLKIDWKTNIISSIIDGIRRNDLTFIEAFKYLDKNNSGSISKDEFTLFLRRIKVNFPDNEVDNLFKLMDKNGDMQIESDEFIALLRDTEEKIQAFRNVTNNSNNLSVIDNSDYLNSNDKSQSNNLNNVGGDAKLKHKYSLIVEREKYYTYKINQMRSRLEETERINKDTSSQLEGYVKKHSELMDKYFSVSEEMQKLKNIFESGGVKREDVSKLEMVNDNLSREVTVLRVGLNTFKDLYKSCSRQIQILNVKSQRNDDEVDTYKKAVKDLQADSNQNALIGKLYYSLLISRWREAASLRKYDDFINEFASLREDNFKCESENKNIIKEVTEIQTVLHEKIIENLRLEDQLQSVTQGFGGGGCGLTHQQLEEFKGLLRDLSAEKTELTEKYFTIRRENLKIQIELEELRNKVDYSEGLANRIKYNSIDEYSKKLVAASEEISKLKLIESVLTRENFFYKENENHNGRLIDHLNKTIKSLEVSNSEWEGKYRKMEEMWRNRDEERQKKFFDNLKNLSLNDMKGNSFPQTGSLAGISGPSSKYPKISEYENKIRELSDVINMKNNEISQLANTNKENEELLKEHALNHGQGLGQNRNMLLSQNNLDILKDDETQLVAQTAYKTIKTLQDMLDTKNTQLKKKDETIEIIKSDSFKMKENYMNVISKLQEQIHLEHDSTMKKLKNVLETVNQNMLIKISKTQLSTMTLADIEALLEEKDNTIKTLAVELKSTKEENEISYLKIHDLNKRINDLNFNINEKKFMSGVESQSEEIQKLKRIIKEKTELIEEEKVRIKRIYEDFSRKLNDRTLMEDQLFKSSVHIPERLVENSEKNGLYAKVQSLRTKNKKLNAEIEKLNKLLEEAKKALEDSNKSSDKIKNENKMFLQTQVKDTTVISRLKKEKDDLILEKDKIKEKVDHLQKLNDVANANSNKDKDNNQNINKLSTSINNQRRGSSVQKKKVIEKAQEKLPDVVKEIPLKSPINVEILKQSSNFSQINEDTCNELLKRLVYFCLKKNINMLRHLQRYDLTKQGKLTTGDFTKAIDELKLGFIENDIQKLLQVCKLMDNYLEIEQFVSIMIEKDKNYEILIKENGNLKLFILINIEFVYDPQSTMKRQPSKKYNPFENKSFNINY